MTTAYSMPLTNLELSEPLYVAGYSAGFTAGLAHAREQAAEQLEARAAEIERAVSGGGVSVVGLIPDALREQSA